jgi:hypothetical protein
MKQLELATRWAIIACALHYLLTSGVVDVPADAPSIRNLVLRGISACILVFVVDHIARWLLIALGILIPCFAALIAYLYTVGPPSTRVLIEHWSISILQSIATTLRAILHII